MGVSIWSKPMDLLMLDTSNDPSEVMTYACLYEIGEKAF